MRKLRQCSVLPLLQWLEDTLDDTRRMEPAGRRSTVGRTGAGQLTYDDMIQKLKAIGVEETYKSISAKINRGTFSFAFFMQCMEAMKIKTLRLAERAARKT